MASSIDRYQKDLERLWKHGGKLVLSLQRLYDQAAPISSNLSQDELENLPDFHSNYQGWYSESLALILQLLPERADDFRAFYAPKMVRKEIRWSNYTISDALRGTSIKLGGQMVAEPKHAVQPMFQQFNILAGLLNRFASTLYDIKTLLHAEVLDDELQQAEELNKKGFQRGAGAIAGVVLEGHLAAVCKRHEVVLRKKEPAISDLNDALKSVNLTDTAQWRFIQHLGDLRNKCDHKKTADPTKDEVTELIEGVRKITKTLI